MLLAQTLEKLRAMGLKAMADALGEQAATPAAADLPFEDRIGLLVDREWDARETRRLQRRLKAAKLKQSAACIEDMDFATPRGLDRGMLLSLASVTGSPRTRTASSSARPAPARRISGALWATALAVGGAPSPTTGSPGCWRTSPWPVPTAVWAR